MYLDEAITFLVTWGAGAREHQQALFWLSRY